MMGERRFALGTRIGDYVLEHDLPDDQAEQVYATRHLVLPRRARLVVLVPRGANRGAGLMREACVLESMRHPGIPRVYDCGVIERRPWVVSELVDGVTLTAMREERALALPELVALLHDAALVLDHAHGRRVTHRALTSDAIVWCAANADFPLHITGWGRAGMFDETEAGELEVGTAGDISALGAIFRDAVAQGVGSRVHSEAALGLSALLERMVGPDPGQRPTAGEVASEAIRLFEVFDLPDRELADEPPTNPELHLPEPVEVVDVELLELAAEHRPGRIHRARWTPGYGVPTVPRPSRPAFKQRS